MKQNYGYDFIEEGGIDGAGDVIWIEPRMDCRQGHESDRGLQQIRPWPQAKIASVSISYQ